MTKMKMPTKIFVKIEGSGEDSYLVADAEVETLVGMCDKLVIGVYELVSKIEAEGIVQIREK